MPCLNTVLTRSTINRTTRKKQTTKQAKTQNIFTAKTQYLKLKAPSNNVKLQSDETLTTQIYIFQITKQMGFCFKETR